MTEITPSLEAKMVMLNGLGYTHAEIGDQLGMSESTVGKYLGQHEDAAKASDDWEAYYWETVTAAVYDEDFRRMLGGYLGGSA